MKMEDIDCIHKDECESYGTWKCKHCKHNKSKKKDYFEPDWTPYIDPWHDPYRPRFWRCRWWFE